MKRIAKSLVIMCLVGLVATKATISAFTSSGQVQRNYFSTGHTDLALLKDLTLPATPENLSQAIPGSDFANIVPFWNAMVGIKLLNTGSLNLETVLAARNLADSLSPDLKDVIMVKVHCWLDDGDGVVQAQELFGTTESKSITSWLSTPFTLGTLPAQQLTSYVIQFDVGDIDDSYQGTSATLDFIFDAIVAE